jgi:hypothetical protein
MGRYDPEELYEETTIEEMGEWLRVVEENLEAGLLRGGVSFNDREHEFIESVREQYDARVSEGRKKPLSGKQLAWLRDLYDRC